MEDKMKVEDRENLCDLLELDTTTSQYMIAENYYYGIDVDMDE